MVKVILEHQRDCTELATGVADLRTLVADADLDDLASRCDIPRVEIEQWPGISPLHAARWWCRGPASPFILRAPSRNGSVTC
jgi:hypothetical protein